MSLELELGARIALTAAPAVVGLEAVRRRRARRRLWPEVLPISDPPPAREGCFRIGRYLPNRGDECVWDPWGGGEQHLAAFGTTAAGKTSLARVLILEAAELWGWEVQVADGKGGVDFTWVRDAGLGLVCTRGAIPTLLREVATEIRRRGELLEEIRVLRTDASGTARAMTPANLRELEPEERRRFGLRPRLVVIDELAMLLATEDRKARPISGPLLEIAAAGRFVGIHLVALMQRGDASLLSGFVGNLLQARALIGATSQVAEHMAHGAEAMAVMEAAAEARGENVDDLERSLRPAGRAVVSGLAGGRPAGLVHLYYFPAVERAPLWHEWVARSSSSASSPASAEPELGPSSADTAGPPARAAGAPPASDSPDTLPAERWSGAGDRGRRTPSAHPGAPPLSAPRGPRLRHRLRLRARALRLIARPLVSGAPRDPTLRSQVAERDGGLCASCRQRVAAWAADHVVPLSRGGRDDLANAQTLCLPCHAVKTAAEARVRAVSRRIRGRNRSGVPWRAGVELARALPIGATVLGVLYVAGLADGRYTVHALIIGGVLLWTLLRSGRGIDGLTYWQKRDADAEEKLRGIAGFGARLWYGSILMLARARVTAIIGSGVYLLGVLTRGAW